MCFIVKHARKGSQLKTFATMTMTLNIYKDEYKASHLDYLRNSFTVESETEQVIKAMNAMGYTLEPINRDKYSIKDEPKWRIVKL